MIKRFSMRKHAKLTLPWVDRHDTSKLTQTLVHMSKSFRRVGSLFMVSRPKGPSRTGGLPVGKDGLVTGACSCTTIHELSFAPHAFEELKHAACARHLERICIDLRECDTAQLMRRSTKLDVAAEFPSLKHLRVICSCDSDLKLPTVVAFLSQFRGVVAVLDIEFVEWEMSDTMGGGPFDFDMCSTSVFSKLSTFPDLRIRVCIDTFSVPRDIDIAHRLTLFSQILPRNLTTLDITVLTHTQKDDSAHADFLAKCAPQPNGREDSRLGFNLSHNAVVRTAVRERTARCFEPALLRPPTGELAAGCRVECLARREAWYMGTEADYDAADAVAPLRELARGADAVRLRRLAAKRRRRHRADAVASSAFYCWLNDTASLPSEWLRAGQAILFERRRTFTE